MRVSEIRVKRIRVNQGLGVYQFFEQKYIPNAHCVCPSGGS